MVYFEFILVRKYNFTNHCKGVLLLWKLPNPGSIDPQWITLFNFAFIHVQGIDGDFWTDVGIWLCCSCCAICQETAEMGTMDYLVTPELQAMERSANDAVGSDNTT